MLKNFNKQIGFILIGVFLITSGCLSVQSLNKQSKSNDNQAISVKNVYLDSSSTLTNNRILVTNGETGQDERFGFLNKDGEVVIDIQYLYSMNFNDGLAKVQLESGYMAFIDEYGKQVINNVNQKNIISCDIFKDGYASVVLEGENDKSYVIDKSGNVILNPEQAGYSYRNLGGGLFERSIGNDYSKPRIIVKTDGSVLYDEQIKDIVFAEDKICYYSLDLENYGIWDSEKDEKITPPLYSNVSRFSGGVAFVITNDGKAQIINEKGECIAELSKLYPTIDIESSKTLISDSVCSIKFKDKQGICLIDSRGDIVAQTQYDYIGEFYDGIAICEQNGKYGYVNSKGVETIKPQYDLATNVEDKIAFVSKDNSIIKLNF